MITTLTATTTLAHLPTPITLSLSRDSQGRGYCESSHSLLTPLQATPYTPSYPRYGRRQDVRDVLEDIISHLDMFVQHAVHAGHKPDRSWLVPNGV